MILKISHGLYIFALIFITAILNKYFVETGLTSFYDSLILPFNTPDNHYFILVWRAFYGILFLSFYIILQSKSEVDTYKDANALFVMQLLLQILWTYSFFYLEQIWFGAVVILLFDALVSLMMLTFLKINFWAFLLLVPYYLWIIFATYMNFSILFLN